MKIRLPDIVLNVASDTAMKSVAQIIEQADAVLDQIKPDAMLVLGDTNSALAVIAAKRRKIPVFHLEAGNRAFDERTPEEINRRIVDHTSDINMTYSQHAKQNLLAEGLPIDRVFCVGSPMKEIFDYYGAQIASSEIIKKLELADIDFTVIGSGRMIELIKKKAKDKKIKNIYFVSQVSSEKIKEYLEFADAFLI